MNVLLTPSRQNYAKFHSQNSNQCKTEQNRAISFGMQNGEFVDAIRGHIETALKTAQPLENAVKLLTGFARKADMAEGNQTGHTLQKIKWQQTNGSFEDAMFFSESLTDTGRKPENLRLFQEVQEKLPGEPYNRENEYANALTTFLRAKLLLIAANKGGL